MNDKDQSTITSFRKQMRAAGLLPIPVNGKVPVLKEWQKKTKTDDNEIELWEKDYPDARNTGLLTREMPTLDADILNQDASEAVEALVRERFKDRGCILVRVGLAPKRAIPFRTDKPFEKITVNLVAPDGATGQKLELLADGQQLVGFGIHPDTGKPYTWHGAEAGAKLKDLPHITEAEAQQLVDDAAQLLCNKFGYTRVVDKKSANGKDGDGTDWGPLLANIHAGHELHDSIRDLAGKLIFSGMDGGAATNILRAAMEACTEPHDERWQDRYDDIPRAVETAEKGKSKTVDEPFALISEPHTFPDERTISKWEFLYGQHLLRKTVSGTAAMGSTGKTSMSLVEALAMASGKPLLGEEVPPPLRVLLICLEDNRNAMDKRIAAAMKRFKLTPQDIDGRLFVKAKGEIKFKIAKQVRGSTQPNTELIEQTIKFLRDNKIDVFSIDPFIKTHGFPENDNSGISDVVDCYDDIAERANCAVALWHHTRKAGGGPVTVESSRGAQAFIDACRSVRVLETMTEAEAQKQRIDHYRRYFRAFSGKLNFAPATDKSAWYQITSVPILNGALSHCAIDGGNGGDNVGVIEAWELPATREVDLTAEQLTAIKTAVAQSEWRENIQAAMWVGKAIAPVLGLDPEDDKPALKKLTKKLIGDGVLKVVAGTRDHKPCLFVVAADANPRP